jgi:hypothetical protein
MDPGCKLELCRIPISMQGTEHSKAMGGIGPRAYQGAKGNGFRGNAREDIERVSRNGIREVRDDSNAVPGIRGFVRRCVSRRSSMRKSRGRFRT